MANTTNFNWETPDDTDLVKDGAAAIRTLGSSIDTSFVDLKGGTTGQILSKASNTDLDYTWIANDQGDITEVQAGTGISVASGTGPIPVVTNTVATTFDAKGDLVVGTGADTFSKLTVGGTNGHTLQVDSSTSTGLKWAAPASGGGLTLINTGGTTLSGASTSVTSIPGTYKNLHIYIEDFYMGSNNNNGYIQFNTTTSDNYAFIALRRSGGNAEANATEGNNDVGIYFSSVGGTTAQGAFAYFLVPNYAATNHRKVATGVSYTKNDGSPGDYYVMNPIGVLQNSSSAITSVQIVSNGSYAGGTVYVYGEN
jgi:hypothetical protein